MELYNNQITMGRLLQDPRARAVLYGAFPQYASNPLLRRMAQNMTLQQAIGIAQNHVSPDRIRQVLAQLRAL